MIAAFENLIIGILAGILGGFLHWCFVRLRKAFHLKKGAKFFGLTPGARCRLVVGQFYGKRAVSQRDVEALMEALSIIQPFKPEVLATPTKAVIEPAGYVTEFCVGGPDSNERTVAHLHEFLVGVRAHSVRDEGHRLEIVTKRANYKYEKGKREYAILAKILVKADAKPVFLVCGQTALANKGALYYLRENYRTTLRKKYGLGQFCLVVRLLSPLEYGHKMVELAEDVSDTAFSDSTSAT